MFKKINFYLIMSMRKVYVFGIDEKVDDTDRLMNELFEEIAREIIRSGGVVVDRQLFPLVPDWFMWVKTLTSEVIICGAIYRLSPGRWGIDIRNLPKELKQGQSTHGWLEPGNMSREISPEVYEYLSPIIESVVKRYAKYCFWVDNNEDFKRFVN
ncbi:hypothetical protein O5O45_07625 [Hahella aquimaris]|uniref:hypothetical protein n=1 Tax=Hahella sp. HNIBRBA332 TaxID=3015983 RepID=UPI00273C13DD|nr:hypothetical protein [Hahella sp. HNIBRBA332]WLQ15782.1 hypothetical protein O5O45_07625 [Hahella sp. HNIBRBA332]